MPAWKEFDGLRNDGAAERYAPGDLVVADNVDIDATGQLSRRAGRRKLAEGAFHSLWARGDVCLLAGGDALLRVHPNYSLETLRTGLAPNAPLSFCPVNERIYWSNGQQTGVVEGGSCRSWGLPVPAAQPVAIGTEGGDLDAGTYQYAITYLRADGQESGASLAGTVEVPEYGAVEFSHFPPPNDPAVVATLVHLSEPGGVMLYHGLTIDPLAAGATISGPTTLGLPLATQFLSPPPAGEIVAYWRGRMYVVVGDTLYWSEPFAYELFDLRHYLQLPGPIRLVAPLDDPEGGIAIATDRMTAWLVGTDPIAFALVEKSDAGAIAGTLAYVPGAHIGDGKLGERQIPVWISTRGIVAMLPRGELVPLSEPRYRADFAGRGAALYQPGDARYLAVLNR